MRSGEPTGKGKVVAGERGGTTTVEEVTVSLCSRSICFYSSTQQETTVQAAATQEEDGARPPSLPRSRWLFPEEDLPVLQWRRPRRCGVGLGNPHALCFMNAVLQALAYTPGVADDLLEGRHSSTCPLAAAAGAARRRARMLQQRHSSSATSSTDGAGNKLSCVAEGGAAVAGGGAGKHGREKVTRLARGGGGRRRSSSSSVVVGQGSSGGMQDTGAEDDASVSFCLLCKLEEQVQSIHCASPLRGTGTSMAQQEQHDPAAEGVVRGFVRNRFSRYVKQFVWKRYREGRQEDAHEFLRYLLDALMRCNSNSSTKRGSSADPLRMPPEVWLTSYFGQLFGGWLQSSVCCSSCGYCSRRFDACLDLPLDLNPAPASAPAACPRPALTGAAAGGGNVAAAGAAATGKRRCNSSSGAEEGGGPPAAKVIKRKLFAGSAAAGAAEGRCGSASGCAATERQGKEQHMHAAAAGATSRRLTGGRDSSSRATERKRRQQALREGGSTVEKALQHFIAKEYLTGDNSYSCPRCKQKRPATKQLRVYTPPRVLVLFIKRFAVGCWGGAARASSFFASHSFLLKNQAPVAFPAVLNLAPYMVSSPPSGRTACVGTTGQTTCSVAGSCPPTTGSLKEEAEPSACAPATRSQQQRLQPSSSLRLEKLGAMSEKSTSSTTRKEDEASPRSNASTNSTSTRASSSPSPSPLRSPPISRTHTSAVSDTPSEHCSSSETAAAGASSDPAAMRLVSVPLVTAARSATDNAGPSPPDAAGGGSANASASPVAPPLYQLYAVVTHSGSSLSSGHYRCFVRAPASAPATACKAAEEAAAAASVWLLIDDEVVQTVSETFVLQRLQHDAYLLFYSRLPTVEQQQELLQQKADQQACVGNALYAAGQRVKQQQQGGVDLRGEKPPASWKQTPTADAMSNSDSSSGHSRSSVSTDSDYSGRSDSDSNSSSSSTWDVVSNGSDDCSGSSSSNSTCSSTSSEFSNCTGDDEILKRYEPQKSALRRRTFPLIAARAHVKAPRKSISTSLQTEGSKSCFFYGKKFRLQRLLALQISLLRRRQRKQGVDAATIVPDRELRESEHLQHDEQQQQLDETGGESTEEKLQTRGKQMKQQIGGIEQRCLREKLNNRIARCLRMLSAEEMRGRVRAASNYASQYGVAQPGTWSDGEEEQNNATAETEVHRKQRQSLRQLAFEHLQELQQPRREMRSRHDREYDRGKVKKVRKKLSTKELAIGETVVVKSRDGDGSALVVHQRTAFDSVVEQQKQGGKRGFSFHAKRQQTTRKQANVRAKQKRQGELKYGRGRTGK